MSPPLLTALSASKIAERIGNADCRVCYVAPGMQDEVAQSLVAQKGKRPHLSITVSLDFDERTLRMGYGSLAAVEMLQKAGIEPTHSPGFRSAILIVDEQGWVFTPTALYLEAEPQSDETPNAIRLAAG